MELTYTSKTALVSGAGRGIGREIAMGLAKAGCTVICSSRNPSSCGAVADEINASGGKALSIPFDVSKPEEIRAACVEMLKQFDSIDILVNNAGITRDNLMMRMSDDDWQSVIATNLSSAFYLTRGLLRPMMGKRWGRIINISSLTGQAGNAGQVNYAAAKAGMIGLTKSLAKEVASRNITVNAVAPGFIETDMTSVLPKTVVDAVVPLIPMKKMGKTQDIAAACLFLASDQACYITGQVIGVNGGLYM